MGTLAFQLMFSYGNASTPVGVNVPLKETINFAITYNEESIKTVLVPPSTTDQAVTLDTVTQPKLVFARSLEGDVTVKLSDGVVATPTPSALSATSGWILIANPNGQAINQMLITTGVAPTGGARVQILAFE